MTPIVEVLARIPLAGWVVGCGLAQITLVILLAAALSRTALRRHAAARHCLWLGALATAGLGPLAILITDYSGLSLVTLRTPVATDPLTPNPEGPQPSREVGPDWNKYHADMNTSGELLSRNKQAKTIATIPYETGTSFPRLAETQEPRPAPTVAASEPIQALAKEKPSTTPSPVTRRTWRIPPARVIVRFILALWAVGVIVSLCRLIVGLRTLRRIRRSLQPWDDSGGLILGIQEALGVGLLPRFYTSRLVVGPVTIGLLRPTVVIPEGLAETLSGEQLRGVLLHECAHAIRRDTRIGVLQRLAATLYWPHPLIHYMNAQLSLAREEICDNFVLRHGDACEYARTLLELTQRCIPAGQRALSEVGLTDVRWSVRDRIISLLDPRRDVMTESNRVLRLSVSLAILAACLGLAGLRPLGPKATLAQEPPKPEAEDSPKTPEPAKAQSPASGIRLTPDRVIHGIVVDEQGNPVAGASVRSIRSEKTPHPATSGADGRFTLGIGGFMLLEERLIASAADDAMMAFGKHLEPIGTEPAQPVRLVLKKSRPLKVRVVTKAGEPVSNASVETLGDGACGSARTDAQGWARLHIPADFEVEWIIGFKEKVGFDYFENYDSFPFRDVKPPPGEVTLTLDGSTTVHVKALGSSGRPVADVKIGLWTLSKPGKIGYVNTGGSEIAVTTTSESGVATFDWMPPDLGQITGFHLLPEFHSGVVNKGDGPDYVAKVHGKTRIEGTVRDANGKPASGVLIQAEGRGDDTNYARLYARSIEDGSYHFDADPEQSYIISVRDRRQAAKSLKGIYVHDGQPRKGLDLTLIEGTVIRGQVSREDGGLPPITDHVTIVQQGDDLPGMIADENPRHREQLVIWAAPDEKGHYEFRVGPGTYELMSPDRDARGETLEVDGEKEIVRDFRIAGSSLPHKVKGVVLRRTPDGDRPVANASITAMTVNLRRRETVAQADAQGQFEMGFDGLDALTFYATDPRNLDAGILSTKADDKSVRIFVSKGPEIVGRLVDPQRNPIAGVAVTLRIDPKADSSMRSRFKQRAMTNAEGRFIIGGTVPGSSHEISVEEGIHRYGYRKFGVKRVDEANLGEIIIEKLDDEKDRANPSSGRIPQGKPGPGGVGNAKAPTRDEVEALIKWMGRDPVTPELIDRAWLLTRPQFNGHVDLDRVRSFVGEPELVKTFDEAATVRTDHPPDTLRLLGQAIRYLGGSDVDALRLFQLREEKASGPSQPLVRGHVVEAETGRPIAGALVYASDALARTDASGPTHCSRHARNAGGRSGSRPRASRGPSISRSAPPRGSPTPGSN
ncbi:M56 family metallopeptidase [Singulisphaera sp. PoT]|uniref:M56 family metallopeptidase n=1 Tax=Singulisphaera sp. PoT TaxID=3411797 RepID=UPI003BF60069